MSKSIMVPLDGTNFAEKGLALATDIAQQRKSSLRLLRVVSAQNEVEQAESYLESKAEQARKRGVSCQCLVKVGSPTETIIECSKQQDLILITSHVFSKFDNRIIGDNTETVIRDSHCHVLVLRDNDPRLRDIRKVLVPLDGQGVSQQALTEAASICRATGATLILGRVQESGALETSLCLGGEETQLQNEYLESIAKSLQLPHPVETVHERGDVVENLLEIMDTKDIDLTVMTSHARTGLQRWVYGSVTEHLLRLSQAPVLVVRTHSQLAEKRQQQDIQGDISPVFIV